jgi:hypothetical protein
MHIAAVNGHPETAMALFEKGVSRGTRRPIKAVFAKNCEEYHLYTVGLVPCLWGRGVAAPPFPPSPPYFPADSRGGSHKEAQYHKLASGFSKEFQLQS